MGARSPSHAARGTAWGSILVSTRPRSFLRLASSSLLLCQIDKPAKLNPLDRHVQARLKKEPVIWLVTASKAGRPQAVPVWFIWDGKSFLIFAQPGVKVNQIKANPHVE